MFLLSIDPGFNNLGFAYGALKATLDPKIGTIDESGHACKHGLATAVTKWFL